jgi:hypothetical protein
MPILKHCTLLGHGLNFLIAFFMISSTFIWSGHINPLHLHLEHSWVCMLSHGARGDNTTPESQSLSLTGHCTHRVDLFTESVLIEPEEDWEVFHSFLAVRTPCGLMRFQSELDRVRSSHLSYQAPKLYLRQGSFLC